LPEGPEVETVRRSLERLLTGRRLGKPWVSALKLRRATTSRALSFLTGREVRALGRHGKLLWLELDDDAGVMVRLGMTGQLLIARQDAPRAKHTHVVVPLSNGDAEELRYVDARRFGEVVPYRRGQELADALARLGPDPISLTDEDIEEGVAKLRATHRTLKDAVLDQRLFAGVGNIYACEALFVARLSPLLRGDEVSRPKLRRLVLALAEVLQSAVRHRGTTFSDFVDGQGGYGENQAFLHVFQREGEPCPECGRAVERVVQGGRSTFLCRKCQPLRRR